MKYLLSNKNFCQWKIKWYLNENPFILSKGSGLLTTSPLKKKELDYFGNIAIISSCRLKSEVTIKKIYLKYIGKATEFYPISLKDENNKLLAFNIYIDDDLTNKQPLIMVDLENLNNFIPRYGCIIL